MVALVLVKMQIVFFEVIGANIVLSRMGHGTLLWWSVVKNPSATVGNTGSVSGLGRFHMPPVKQSLYAAITEACLPTACAAQQERPLHWEA